MIYSNITQLNLMFKFEECHMLRPRQLLFILSIECIEKYKDTVGVGALQCISQDLGFSFVLSCQHL